MPPTTDWERLRFSGHSEPAGGRARRYAKLAEDARSRIGPSATVVDLSGAVAVGVAADGVGALDTLGVGQPGAGLGVTALLQSQLRHAPSPESSRSPWPVPSG